MCRTHTQIPISFEKFWNIIDKIKISQILILDYLRSFDLFRNIFDFSKWNKMNRNGYLVHYVFSFHSTIFFPFYSFVPSERRKSISSWMSFYFSYVGLYTKLSFLPVRFFFPPIRFFYHQAFEPLEGMKPIGSWISLSVFLVVVFLRNRFGIL